MAGGRVISRHNKNQLDGFHHQNRDVQQYADAFFFFAKSPALSHSNP